MAAMPTHGGTDRSSDGSADSDGWEQRTRTKGCWARLQRLLASIPMHDVGGALGSPQFLAGPIMFVLLAAGSALEAELLPSWWAGAVPLTGLLVALTYIVMIGSFAAPYVTSAQEQRDGTASERYCGWCDRWVLDLPRTKHCHECDACVLEFDHQHPARVELALSNPRTTAPLARGSED